MSVLAAPDRGVAETKPRESKPRPNLLSRPGRGLWWTAPIGTLLAVIPLSLAVAVQIPDSDYRLFYKAPRAIGGSDAALYLFAAGALALGTLIPLALRPGRPRRNWPSLPSEDRKSVV